MLKALCDKKTKLYQVETLVTGEPSINSLAISPDGTFILACNPMGIKMISFGEKKSIFCKNLWKQISFCNPESVVFSPDGRYVIVTNTRYHTIHKIFIYTGVPILFAGFAGRAEYTTKLLVGQKTQVEFFLPSNVVFSPDGTFIVVCDYGNKSSIRGIDLKTGKVTLFVGKSGITNCNGDIINGCKEQAIFVRPRNVTFSPDGKYALVCEWSTHCIRRICLVTNQVSTFAGIAKTSGYRNGPKEQALFVSPRSLTFSLDGQFVFVAGKNNIRLICVKSGEVSNFAGTPHISGNRNGIKEQAQFQDVTHLLCSQDGKFLLICDKGEIKFIKIKN